MRWAQVLGGGKKQQIPTSESEELLFGGRLLYDYGFSRHEDATSNTPPFQLVRSVPRIFTEIIRLCWSADRCALSVVAAADIFRAFSQALGLLAVNSILSSLASTSPVHERICSAIPSIIAATVLSAVSVGLAKASDAASGQLGPKVERAATIGFLSRVIRVELAALEDPEFHRLLDSARYGASSASRSVGPAVAVINSAISISTTAGVLGILHPVLVGLIFLIAVPKGWAAARTMRCQYESTQAWMQHFRASHLLTDLILEPRAAPEARVHSVGKFLLKHFKQMSAAAVAEQTRLARLKASTELVASAAAGVAAAATYVTLGLLIISGSMNIAVAGTAVLAIQSGTLKITTLVTQMNQLYKEMLFVRDLHFLFSEADRLAIPPGGEAIGEGPRLIVLEKVSFTYPGRTEPALDDVSISIERGRVIALVGENGSGKTTLAKIIAGLYEPDQGHVFWDGVDVRKVDRDQIFECVGMLPQDFQRWPFTAFTNVVIGRPSRDLDEESVAQAAMEAGVKQIIESLPNGWNTLIARGFSGGVELSGGQWQRLNFARFRYRSAPLVICDEPTSALDAKAEIEAFENIRALAEKGNTVILITHRLASVRHADSIYVLANGRIVENGTHAELLDYGENYAKMFRLQASQFGI